MFEVLDFYNSQIGKSTVLDKLSLTPSEYFVVSVHREENVNDHFGDFIALLNRLADFGQRIIVTCHPRTRKRLDETRIPFNSLVEFHRPFGFFDYVNLQKNARCTLSDSGTISEESSILRFPALMLRTNHERPECDEKGGVIMVGFDVKRVMESLEIAQKLMYRPDAYCVSNLSDTVVRAILSHTRR
jgi:UDP-N-acetylglucosamine 2-epimerase (non-hydrolysing)